MHFPTLLTVALGTLTTASPLYARTALSQTGNGAIRPSTLVTRDLEVLVTYPEGTVGTKHAKRQDSSSPTGSTSTDCSGDSGVLLGSVNGLLTGGGGCATSGQSASNSTSSTTSASCQFLGGCTGSGSAACEVDSDNVDQTNKNASSSICGTSTSTDSSGFGSSGLLGGSLGGGGGSKLRRALEAIGAKLSGSKAKAEVPVVLE